MAAGAFGKLQRSSGFWSKVKNFGKKVVGGLKKVGATVLDGVSAFAGGVSRSLP